MEPVNVLEWAVYEVQLSRKMRFSGLNRERTCQPGEKLTGVAVSDGWLIDVGFLLWRAEGSIGAVVRRIDIGRVPAQLRFSSYQIYVSSRQKAIHAWLNDPLVRLAYSLEEDL